MPLVFVLLSLMTLGGAVAAISLRNLVHCALALTVTFAGLAALYLQLSAQFVGFAQILVYIGAVAILIVFAILLTRGAEPSGQAIFSEGSLWGGAVAVAVFSVLGGMILSSKALLRPESPAPPISVRQLGDQLMTKYILPLEVLGLLLTAALIGAVVIAMREKNGAAGGQVDSGNKAGPETGTTRGHVLEAGGRMDMSHGQNPEVSP
jgi:NADH-quinone oxidoreductase subunit J